jgi:ferric-dicitrate binding protein FerR (iron transport regulator)
MYDRFRYLVGKRLKHTASFSEEEELEKLLTDEEELKQLYSILFLKDSKNEKSDIEQAEQAYATHVVKLQLAEEFNMAQEIAGEYQEESNSSNSKFIYWFASIAACLLLVIGGWYMVTSNNKLANDNNGIAKNEVFTKKGSKSKITLPDGSLVWLNADSKISYSGDFQGAKREIQLTGEAYFDVKKDKSRPFIIHTKSIDVRVLGTAFNVRSYPSEKITETSLIRGSVEIILHSFPGKDPIILKPNEKLTVNNVETNLIDSAGNPVVSTIKQPEDIAVLTKIHFKKNDSTVAESSWIENKLVFDDEPFERVVANIERWYNVEFIIKNSAIKSKHFSAVFENKSLGQVLEALSLAWNFSYEMKDNKVIIR